MAPPVCACVHVCMCVRARAVVVNARNVAIHCGGQAKPRTGSCVHFELREKSAAAGVSSQLEDARSRPAGGVGLKARARFGLGHKGLDESGSDLSPRGVSSGSPGFVVGPRLPKGTRTRAERLPGEQPGATHNVLEGDRTAAGRLEYPTRWRHPYAEGCVRMAPKTLATLMRTRVRKLSAWRVELGAEHGRDNGLRAAPAFLPNTWRGPHTVSPGKQV